MEIGIINYPKELVEMARGISIERSNKSKNVYCESNIEKYRGDQESTISYLGVLGEMIIQWWFHKELNITNYITAPLVDEAPVVGADLTYDDFLIDIKTTDWSDANHIQNGSSFSHNQLAVNERTFNRCLEQENVNQFLFVCLLPNNRCKLFMYSIDEVKEWRLRKLKYTKAYCNILKQTNLNKQLPEIYENPFLDVKIIRELEQNFRGQLNEK